MNLNFDISRYVDSFLNITGYFTLSYIGKLISSGGHFLVTFCWSINYWVSSNYKVYFRHVQTPKHCLYLTHFNLFSFRESWILTVKYDFGSYLVVKLYKSGLEIIHLNSDHLRFLDSVKYWRFFIMAYLKR